MDDTSSESSESENECPIIEEPNVVRSSSPSSLSEDSDDVLDINVDSDLSESSDEDINTSDSSDLETSGNSSEAIDLSTSFEDDAMSDVSSGDLDLFEALSENDNFERQENRLSEAEIGRLPIRTFNCIVSSLKKTQEEGQQVTRRCDCGICCSDYENGDKLRTLPCFHDFHVHCIDRWLKMNSACPLCRQNVIIEKTIVESVPSMET